MKNFNHYIEKNYSIPLTLFDQKSLHDVLEEEHDSLEKKIERKYQLGANIIKATPSPEVKKTVHSLLQKSPQDSIKSLTRIIELIKIKEAGYLDTPLFEKYHRIVINKYRTHLKLIDLYNEAKDLSFKPEEFRNYLESGLFDDGVYTLQRGPSKAELNHFLDEIRLDVYEKYQLNLSEKDEEFILNNRVRNNHIITQIVVPKYRISYEIINLLGGHYMDAIIQNLLGLGLNEGTPILKRLKTLAEWYNDGYLSKALVKKCYHTLVHDLDELEEFVLFLEKISEYIGLDRAIHYMELGLYEVYEETRFQNLLMVEQYLYDIRDDLNKSVLEYIRIMKTPGESKSLITNRRLSQCFHIFVNLMDMLLTYSELLDLNKYLPKLQHFQTGFKTLLQECQRKSPILPTQKPYKAMEFIHPFTKIFYSIESENLFRLSHSVIEFSQPELAKEKYTNNKALAEFIERFQLRSRSVQEVLDNPKETNNIISHLIPFEKTYLYEIEQYIKPKNE